MNPVNLTTAFYSLGRVFWGWGERQVKLLSVRECQKGIGPRG